jgi:putative copper export protein
MRPREELVSAEATTDRLTPGQVRIVLREGGAGVASFVGFVVAVAAAIYVLTPAARARPTPLICLVAVAIAWAGVAAV